MRVIFSSLILKWRIPSSNVTNISVHSFVLWYSFSLVSFNVLFYSGLYKIPNSIQEIQSVYLSIFYLSA